jgi:hypothetical protein
MGEEFYSSIKLVSGEEIFSLVSIDENDGDPIVVLQNPVVIKIITNQSGQFVKIKPWMEIPSDDFFIIRLEKIITMTEVKDELIINCYNNFIESDDDEDNNTLNADITGKVKISDKMGYLSSVEEARKRLENIFKNNKDPKES